MLKLLPNKNMRGVYHLHRKILRFENPSDYISDEDITDLFLGLVNLIKKSAEIKIEEKYLSYVNTLKKELSLLKSKSSK